MAACACATVTPSRRRAFTKKPASSGFRSSARAGPPRLASAAIGSQKSVTMPDVDRGVVPCRTNPTIVTGTPSTRMVRPTTEGSARNFDEPRGVAHHGHDRGPAHVVGLGEPAAERGAQAQHRGSRWRRRIRPPLAAPRQRRDSARPGARSPPSCRRTRRCRPPCRDRPDTNGVDAAGVDGALIDVDEPVGVAERLRPEQRGVDHAEERRIGADAEGEDEHRGGSERPVAGEPAKGVTSVLPAGPASA